MEEETTQVRAHTRTVAQKQTKENPPELDKPFPEFTGFPILVEELIDGEWQVRTENLFQKINSSYEAKKNHVMQQKLNSQGGKS